MWSRSRENSGQRGGICGWREEACRQEKTSGNRRGWLRNTKAGIIMALVLGLTSLCLAGCGTDDIDISGYADQTITISGTGKEDVTLSIADLKAMDCLTTTTESTSDKIGRVRATGPTLDTVLRQYGRTQAEMKGARIHGSDGYDVKLDADTLAEETIILAFGIDGRPLGEEDAPLRLIIPESDSAWWVRMVDRIELTN